MSKIYCCVHKKNPMVMNISSYLIEDLDIERQFRVSMNLKACFEASSDAECLINADIFQNTLVPKSICNWTAGFSTPSKPIFASFLTECYFDFSTIFCMYVCFYTSNSNICPHVVTTFKFNIS